MKFDVYCRLLGDTFFWVKKVSFNVCVCVCVCVYVWVYLVYMGYGLLIYQTFTSLFISEIGP